MCPSAQSFAERMLCVQVGAFQEETGSTGIAHLLEHMAFKGTTTVGTSNWALEQPLLDAQVPPHTA